MLSKPQSLVRLEGLGKFLKFNCRSISGDSELTCDLMFWIVKYRNRVKYHDHQYWHRDMDICIQRHACFPETYYTLFALMKMPFWHMSNIAKRITLQSRELFLVATFSFQYWVYTYDDILFDNPLYTLSIISDLPKESKAISVTGHECP
jgi:hypothetical protein